MVLLLFQRETINFVGMLACYYYIQSIVVKQAAGWTLCHGFWQPSRPVHPEKISQKSWIL